MDLSDRAILARLIELPGSAARLFCWLYQITTVYGGKILYGLYVAGWISFYYAWGGFKGLLYYYLLSLKWQSKLIFLSFIKLWSCFSWQFKVWRAAPGWFYHYSGLEFIYRKFRPIKNQEPLPTGLLWLIGIYVALFGIASQRYENRVDLAENAANILVAQLATDARKEALSQISSIQSMPCPVNPEIFNPVSSFNSLFKETICKDVAERLKGTIVAFKNDLENANLSGAYLRGANIQNFSLKNAILASANLEDTNLEGVNLENADLSHANLKGVIIWNTNLKSANLSWANLEGIYYKAKQIDDTLSEFLSQAGIEEDRPGDIVKKLLITICRVDSINGAKLENEFKKEIKSKCPDILKGSFNRTVRYVLKSEYEESKREKSEYEKFIAANPFEELERELDKLDFDEVDEVDEVDELIAVPIEDSLEELMRELDSE